MPNPPDRDAAPATITELAAARAAYEVRRVKNSAADSFDGHPMADLPNAAWEYIADLLRDAYLVGAAEGERAQMARINTRYSLRARIGGDS